MKKRIEYNVPDGYFEGLRTKLSAIPAQEERPSRVQRFAPYLALAACFGVAVLVGNLVEDVHDTYAGMKPGTVITYHAIRAILNNEHMVSFSLMFFIGALFFLISLSLFSNESIIKKIPFIKHAKSRVLRFMLSFIGYAFVLTATTTVLYMFFDQSISILIPSFFFSIQKSIINHKRAKS